MKGMDQAGGYVNPNMSKELIDLVMKELIYHERVLEY